MSTYETIEKLSSYRNDPILSFSREVACFCTDVSGVIAVNTSNSPGHVEFDFFTIWEAIKNGERTPNCACMTHTHPPGVKCMSHIDKNMVHGWCVGLGLPVFCFIVADYALGCYRCEFKNSKLEIKDISDRYRSLSSAEEFMYSVIYGMSMSPDDFDENELIEIRNILHETLKADIECEDA